MSQPPLPLLGCAPEPLMNYLKALGVLRAISQGKSGDPSAKGEWRNGVFVLHSKFDRDSLMSFILNDYEPAPLIAPWGARSGFLKISSHKTARATLSEIEKSTDQRLARYRVAIQTGRQLMADLGLDAKADDDEKLELLLACRNQLPDDVLQWLDVCYALTNDGRKYPPLLGTGGNEGSGSYVSGFAQQIVACLIKREHDESLSSALFGHVRKNAVAKQTPGHFSPNAAGGPNAGQGLEGTIRMNPWDYIFGLEGACAWACGVVRRFGGIGRNMAAFPFTVNVSGAGNSVLTLRDSVKPKKAKRDIAEIWLPLWSRPMSFAEVDQLLCEGRISVGRRAAENGVDAIRAISSLGVDRGIDRFQRIGFLMRNGQNFLGVSLGSVEVHERNSASLLADVDLWLSRFRQRCAIGQKNEAPSRFGAALRRIDAAIFDYCRYGDEHFISILLALGQAEREVANGDSFRVDRSTGRTKVPPLTGLSPTGLPSKWIEASNDGSPEFRLALSLAAIFDREQKVGPLRANLEAFDWTQRRRADWATKDRRVVWNSADLATNLASILARRMMDATRLGCTRLPLDSQYTAPLDAVASFLAGEAEGRPFNDERLEELLWGLMLIDHNSDKHEDDERLTLPLPRAYALLKLLFLHAPVVLDRGADGHVRSVSFASNGERGLTIKPEPQIVSLLQSGRPDSVGEACRIAARRLRASGITTLPHRTSGGSNRDANWEEAGCGLDGRRLAAALLFPLSSRSLTTLFNLVARPESESSDDDADQLVSSFLS